MLKKLRLVARCVRIASLYFLFSALSLAAGHCHAADNGIAASIARGAEYLISTQSAAGSWNTWQTHELGETALCGMALLAAGQPADSRNLVLAAKRVRELTNEDTSTYGTALAIMFLDRFGKPSDAELLQQLGARLCGGQCGDGSWSYNVPRSVGGNSCPLGGVGNGGDNSNTQFAALAAWVSRRHGVNADTNLDRLDKHFRGTFDPSAGGWAYVARGGATPTMTCAGLVGLATYRGAEMQRRASASAENGASDASPRGGRQGRAAADDPVAKRALAALGGELKRADRDWSSSINKDLYFLWSLERVGVIYDVRDIGGVDWYQWGSRRLKQSQARDGQWIGTGSKGWPFETSVGTSFAILFLSRANAAADLTAQVGSGGGVGAEPPGLGGGSQFLQRGGDSEPPPFSPQPQVQSQRRRGKQPEQKPDEGPGVLDPF